MLARSAPEKPGVPRARTLRSTSSLIGILRVSTRKTSSRPRTSAMVTTTRRSKRPGRSSAGSSTSGRLVAAIRMTPSLDSKPSISTSNWFRVCSRSSCPPPRPAPRWRPTASISSMKMMQGAFFLPCSKRSRTRLAPTPTNISTKSEPEIEKNGTLASPATARASSVLPVPGGPTSSTPLGSRPPSFCTSAGPGRPQPRLAGSRSPPQQHALGNPPAPLLKLRRLAQVIDDLLQFFLGLVDAGYVLECDLLLLHREQARPALAERQRLVAPRLHLPQHEEPDEAEQNERAYVEQNGKQKVALRRLDSQLHLGCPQRLLQLLVVAGNRGVKRVRGRALHVARQLVALDGRIVHRSRLIEQIRVAELSLLSTHACASLHHAPKQHEADENKDPEHDRFDGRIHQDSSFPVLEKPLTGSPAPPPSPFRRRHAPQSRRKYTKP